jgi:hypothetical protein
MWWAVIPDTWEAELRRIVVQDQSGQKVTECSVGRRTMAQGQLWGESI